jgi:hypothetical protein
MDLGELLRAHLDREVLDQMIADLAEGIASMARAGKIAGKGDHLGSSRGDGEKREEDSSDAEQGDSPQ